MIRAIVGILVSYVVMAVVLTLLCLGGFVALGVDRFFQPDSYEVSALWMVLSLFITASTTVLGGYVCAAISRSMTAVKVLAVIVFSLHFVFCFSKMREDMHVRAGDVPIREVMNLAQMPLWMHVLTPTLGAVGILLGARLKRDAARR
jgi:hypothetical protein